MCRQRVESTQSSTGDGWRGERENGGIFRSNDVDSSALTSSTWVSCFIYVVTSSVMR